MGVSAWVIVSWVLVGLLTTINVVIFLKLKAASEQMMKQVFPGAKNMGEALQQMQGLMNSMGGAKNRGGMAPFAAAAARNNPQLKAAMEKLAQLQKKR